MPLKSGTSKEAISSNVSELLHSFKSKGRIGNTRPRDKAHAARIAKAIAMDKARSGSPSAAAHAMRGRK